MNPKRNHYGAYGLWVVYALTRNSSHAGQSSCHFTFGRHALIQISRPFLTDVKALWVQPPHP